MLIQNESYDDKIMRLRYEMLLMHSKTGQSLGLDKAEDFDAALEETSHAENAAPAFDETPKAESPRITLSTGRWTLMADIDAILGARTRQWRANILATPAPSSTAGRDTVLTDAAQRYAQAMDVSGQHDTVFVAPA